MKRPMRYATLITLTLALTVGLVLSLNAVARPSASAVAEALSATATPDFGDVTSPGIFWAGYEAIATRGTYKQAEVIFQVPTITGTTGDIVSLWAGLGGDSSAAGNSTELVQAGVDEKKTSSGQSNEAWVEVYPQTFAHFFPKECVIDVGDTIDVYVSSDLNNDGFDYFHISSNSLGCNVACKVFLSGTTKDTCGLNIQGNSVYKSDGYTGECIAERNTSPSFLPLAEWNPPGHLWLQSSCSMNAASIASASYVQRDTVWTCPGYPKQCTLTTELAYPGKLDSNGDFNFVWVARN